MKFFISSIMATMIFASACTAQDVQLPAPQKAGGKTIIESLWSRQSGNEFSDRKLSDQDLSNLLFAAIGVNREDGRITSPTARNFQEIRVFVFTADGVSEYLNKENKLKHLADGDHRDLVAGQQDWVKGAPVSLVIAADEKKFGSSDERSKLMMAVDAGIASENINIFCAGTGLVTRPRGSMDHDGIKKLLNLDDSITLLMNNPVGYAK